MLDRRRFLTRSGLGMLATAGTCLAFSGDSDRVGSTEAGRETIIPDGSASKGMITIRTDEAIQRGLAYLHARRDRNGSFGTGPYRGNVAITSLAAMAFMCAGHQPNRGAYGKVVLDALKYVLSMENVPSFRDNPGGRFRGFLNYPSGSPHGPMYGHGFATLFLSEVYGMVHDRQLREEVRRKLHQAVKLIIDSQNIDGGWRYKPDAQQADISVTICQIMALRSARNAGIFVPKTTVDNCTKYVKACQDRMEGWFRYMKQGGGGGGLQGFARTAAGVCALNAAGVYNSPEVKAGLEFLLRNKPGGGFGRPDMHYFYGHYYAVQAMWTAGGHYWQEWYPAIRDELVNRQNLDSSWIDQICSHYGTAMACIILQVPNNYLPILQK
jgi:hypothetical protein